MKLSIIIPFYKTHEETERLLKVLRPQLTDEVEIIIINNSDITTFKGVKTLFCESNGTASKPRNVGLDNAKGEYITFIDSDDLVSEDYIEKILDKVEISDFDYCLFSWEYLNKDEKIIIQDLPPRFNTSIWNCIYKKSLIGNNRFNEEMRRAEDADFNRRVRKGKKENIIDILYYYNDDREGSITTGHNESSDGLRYIIMAGGVGSRWNNYSGKTKHLIDVGGETLLERTVRLLKENGVENIFINSNQDYVVKETKLHYPKNNVYEIDRFLSCKDIWGDEVVFLYGDVYYTEKAMKTITSYNNKSFRYFGRSSGGKHAELFAIKLNDKKEVDKFHEVCLYIRKQNEEGKHKQGLGWHTYMEMIGESHLVTLVYIQEFLAKGKLKNFTEINDETDDFDTPLDYEIFNNKIVFYFHKIWLGGSFKATLSLIQKIYKDYNVVVAYRYTSRPDLVRELEKYVPVLKANKKIYCNTVINVTLQKVSPNIIYKRGISWVHSAIKDLNINPELFDERVVVSKHGKTHVKNSKIIYNEIDSNIKELSKKYEVEQYDGLKLVMICRLSKEKGFENLLQIIKEIKQDYKLYIVGGASNTDYLYELREMFKDYNVEFVGEKRNPYPYIKWADYLLVTSTRETWNLTITEAFALGTPIVATYFPALKEQLIEGENGYLYTKDVWNKPIPKPKYKDNKNYLEWDLGKKVKPTHKKVQTPVFFKDLISGIKREKNDVFIVEHSRYMELKKKAGIKLLY